MAERVILHIGPRKTGTTYLQSVLWDNRPQLEAQGFWLPLDSSSEQYEAVGRGRKGWWSSGTPERAGELWAELVDQVRSRPGVPVISTELFSSIHIDETAAMLAELGDVGVDVVFGVRALARAIPAEWQQWVRARSRVTYDEWLATLRDDPAHGFWKTQAPIRIINRWSALTPPERIRAVIVPTSTDDPSVLWDRFAAAIGLEPAGFTLPAVPANASLGVVQAELLRRVNEAVDPEFSNFDYRRRIRRNVTSAVLLGAEGARSVVLPNSEVAWVEERSAELADALEQSGIAVHGDLADLHVPTETPGDDGMKVSEAELLDAAVATILGMADRAAAQNQLIWKLRQQVEVAGEEPPATS